MSLVPVLVTPPSGDVVTLTEAKAWLWVDHTSDDTLIGAMIAGAIANLDGWNGILGRCLLTQVWRQDFAEWDARGELRLPFKGVTAVAVKYYDSDNTLQTVSSSLYELLEDASSSFVRFKADFSEPSYYDRSDAIQVTVTAGYADAAAVPEAIKTAIKMMVAHWYANRETVAAQQMSTVPFAAEHLLMPYRSVNI